MLDTEPTMTAAHRAAPGTSADGFGYATPKIAIFGSWQNAGAIGIPSSADAA